MRVKLPNSIFRAFAAGVIDRYTREPERYSVRDDVLGGSVYTRDKYLGSLPTRRRIAESVSISYVKRRLTSGETVVIPWPLDFDKLSRQQRQHWASWEIRNPKYEQIDRDYEKAYLQEYEGRFVDPIDPLYDVKHAVEHVAARYGLYRNTENPNLRYPLLGNSKSYSESHNELRKLVGPDNMDARKLKRYLRLFDEAYKEDEGSWSLFRRLVNLVAGENPREILEPLEKCNRERSLVAHEIQVDTAIHGRDYIYEFRCDCDRVAHALDRLGLRLTWRLNRNKKEATNA